MIEIRSFRRVFDLERRIYSIDRFRLNPGGVPLRGVVYGLLTVLAVVVLSAMPLMGAATRLAPWYLRDLIAPGVLAGAMSIVRVDGRTFHLAARGALGMALSPRRVARLAGAPRFGARWAPPEVWCLPDGSDAALRRLRYEGPGAVLIQVEHRRGGVHEDRRTGLARRATTLRITGPATARHLARGQVIELERGARLLVDPR